MKKFFQLLLLTLGLTYVSYADYLDDWPDEALCGWMDNPSPPSYMVEEVKTRDISCSGGNLINLPPELPLPPPEEGPELLLPLLIPPKINPGIEYAPETVPGADPKIVPDLPPVVDKPPSDPNPPPILYDPTDLQPGDPG